jgi:ABC-type multidrug transport system fused ATPase/permease subunit
MLIKKNKLYQYIFLLIITLMVIFNGGNNNLYIQFNFIIISIFFLLFIREKNYSAHVREIFSKNKIAILLYSLFISFLIFQTIPLPIEWLNFLSPEKYNILNELEFKENFSSISLSPTNSYFSLLNYLSIFLYLIIFKSLFYRNKDIFKFYYFLVCLGAFAASVAIYFYLIGNPDFWILKNNRSYATGFFINRTVFSCFLTLCFFSGIEYLKIIDHYQKNNTNNFFNKIYVRLFLLLITIAIITSFSRLGNFLFISLIIIYISQALYKNDKRNRFFLITLILIVLFDVLVLGFYFGSEKLLQRYSFLQNEINEYSPSSGEVSLSRGEMAKFAFIEFKKFIFFGYGGGGFESLLKINFQNLSTLFATHAHSDIMEFLGEFGLVGFTLITLSFLFSCANKKCFSFKDFLLCYLLILILIFDFSFHIPIIQLLFVLLLSICYERSNKLEI